MFEHMNESPAAKPSTADQKVCAALMGRLDKLLAALARRRPTSTSVSLYPPAVDVDVNQFLAWRKVYRTMSYSGAPLKTLAYDRAALARNRLINEFDDIIRIFEESAPNTDFAILVSQPDYEAWTQYDSPEYRGHPLRSTFAETGRPQACGI